MEDHVLKSISPCSSDSLASAIDHARRSAACHDPGDNSDGSLGLGLLLPILRGTARLRFQVIWEC